MKVFQKTRFTGVGTEVGGGEGIKASLEFSFRRDGINPPWCR